MPKRCELERTKYIYRSPFRHRRHECSDINTFFHCVIDLHTHVSLCVRVCVEPSRALQSNRISVPFFCNALVALVGFLFIVRSIFGSTTPNAVCIRYSFDRSTWTVRNCERLKRNQSFEVRCGAVASFDDCCVALTSGSKSNRCSAAQQKRYLSSSSSQ